jgi:dTDP-4-amino-4,6-dideoxygalactose transaminase
MIFLGLASNYPVGRTLRHLFAWGIPKDSQALRQALASHYGSTADQVALYRTGRSALAAALLAVAEPGAKVILPGLTCIAVVRAIKAAGCIPVYSDIDPETLQYDFDTLDKTLTLCYNGSNGSTSPAFPCPGDASNSPENTENNLVRAKTQPRPVVIAQNTLGLPLDAEKLEEVVKKHNAIIIEDLAHSAGRFYPDGREIGTIGAATALSFGKGKAIDTICGGALIVRRPKTAPRQPTTAPEQLKTMPEQSQATSARPQSVPDQPLKRPRLSASLRDRWYPVFAGLSRAFWGIGLGKAILAACVKFRWIEKSADAELSLETRSTHWQAKLAREQLGKLPKTPLREHAFVKNRDQLLQELKHNGYDFCEIWYDTPVSPVRYALEADFPTDRCPNTVKVAQYIINLPTWYPEAKLTRAREIIKPYEVDL